MSRGTEACVRSQRAGHHADRRTGTITFLSLAFMKCQSGELTSAKLGTYRQEGSCVSAEALRRTPSASRLHCSSRPSSRPEPHLRGRAEAARAVASRDTGTAFSGWMSESSIAKSMYRVRGTALNNVALLGVRSSRVASFLAPQRRQGSPRRLPGRHDSLPHTTRGVYRVSSRLGLRRQQRPSVSYSPDKKGVGYRV
jgi:hypothetical protein